MIKTSRTAKCSKCGSDKAIQFGTQIIKDGIVKDVYFSGPYWCDICDESFCDECGSHNLEYYDDGEGYPPNILCNDCGNWPQ